MGTGQCAVVDVKFEVLGERAPARYVPAHKDRELYLAALHRAVEVCDCSRAVHTVGTGMPSSSLTHNSHMPWISLMLPA